MDRRAKKLEKKRKDREQAKKTASALAAKRPSDAALMIRSASRREFGPCYVSSDWKTSTLISVIATRRLANGQLLPALGLADRLGMGLKDGFLAEPMTEKLVEEFAENVGTPHGGMDLCSPLVVQSIVYHLIDSARSLGFEPHPDFPEAMFGPRPEELLSLPGTGQILAGLSDSADGMLVHSPLERVISRDGQNASISIYRGAEEAGWILEVEDHDGDSIVWDEQFSTDQAALDAALQAIEQDGLASVAADSAADGGKEVSGSRLLAVDPPGA